MATALTIAVPHSLGTEEAMRRLTDGVSALASSSLAKIVTLKNASWRGDTLTFEARAFAQTWTGSIAVHDADAVFSVPLPFYLRPLRGSIESLVLEHGSNLFA